MDKYEINYEFSQDNSPYLTPNELQLKELDEKIKILESLRDKYQKEYSRIPTRGLKGDLLKRKDELEDLILDNKNEIIGVKRMIKDCISQG